MIFPFFLFFIETRSRKNLKDFDYYIYGSYLVLDSSSKIKIR